MYLFFVMLLCLPLTQAPAPAGGAEPTLDQATLAVLYAPGAFAELQLSDAARGKLRALSEERAAQLAKLPADKKSALRLPLPTPTSPELAEARARIEAQFRQHVAQTLAPGQLQRLREITLQGAAAHGLLFPWVQRELALTPAQQKTIAYQLGQLEDRIYVHFIRTPLEPQSQAAEARVARLHAEQLSQLTTQLLEHVLTAEQRTRWHALCGAPIKAPLKLLNARMLLERMQAKMNPPKVPEPFCPLSLSASPIVCRLVGITPAEAQRLAAIAAEWRALNAAFYRSLVPLTDEARAPLLSRWSAELKSRRRRFEADAEAVLGPERWQRLLEIRLQLMGAGAVCDSDVSQTLNVTPDQTRAILQVVQGHQEEMSQHIRELAQGAEVGKQRGIPGPEWFARQRLALDQKILNVLEPMQRLGWEALIGKPLPARDLQQLLQEIAPLGSP